MACVESNSCLQRQAPMVSKTVDEAPPEGLHVSYLGQSVRSRVDLSWGFRDKHFNRPSGATEDLRPKIEVDVGTRPEDFHASHAKGPGRPEQKAKVWKKNFHCTRLTDHR